MNASTRFPQAKLTLGSTLSLVFVGVAFIPQATTSTGANPLGRGVILKRTHEENPSSKAALIVLELRPHWIEGNQPHDKRAAEPKVRLPQSADLLTLFLGSAWSCLTLRWNRKRTFDGSVDGANLRVESRAALVSGYCLAESRIYYDSPHAHQVTTGWRGTASIRVTGGRAKLPPSKVPVAWDFRSAT